MLVLLPPSESKTTGGDGPPVEPGTLSFPTLDPLRFRVARTLQAMCAGNPARARDRLGLSPTLDDERAADAQLLSAPTLPAARRYAGVLYDALGHGTLGRRAQDRADSHVIVLSALWGAVRLDDPLPHYRLGVASRLPRLPSLPALWARSPLAAALDAAVVAAGGALDLRSSGYVPLWRPRREVAPLVHPVRLVGADGRRAAASYPGKVAKGRLVRELCRSGRLDVDGLLAAAAALGLRGDRDRRSGRLTVRLPAGWGLVSSR